MKTMKIKFAKLKAKSLAMQMDKIREEFLEFETATGYQDRIEEAFDLIQKYGKQRVNELAESFMRSESQKAAEDISPCWRQWILHCNHPSQRTYSGPEGTWRTPQA